MKSQSLSKLLKLYTEGAHRALSGKLFQQFTRRRERENARALFVHCGLNTLNLPLVWLLIVKLKRLSSVATIERDSNVIPLPPSEGYCPDRGSDTQPRPE